MHKNVGFVDMFLDELAGIFELRKYGGVQIVLHFDPFAYWNLCFLDFLFDLEMGVGPIIENGQNATDLFLFEIINIVEDSNRS